jgi:hypothetical protein
MQKKALVASLRHYPGICPGVRRTAKTSATLASFLAAKMLRGHFQETEEKRCCFGQITHHLPQLDELTLEECNSSCSFTPS